MRRLVLIAVALALLGLGTTAGAGASPKKPWPPIVEGAAHVSGTKAEGWFFVKDTAARPSRAAKVYIGVANSRGATFLGYRRVPPLRPGKRRRIRFSYQLPKNLKAGGWRINLCTGGKCLDVAIFTVPAAGGASSSSAGEKSNAGGGATAPISTIPTDPIPHPVAEPFFHAGGGAEYWAFVPRSYDASNLTPTTLLIWLHGCYGEAEGDAWVVDPGAEEGVPQDWLTLVLSGREGGTEGECWIPSVDEAKVMAALADFETHFNVDRRRVILGGYSSGGDLAYRTGFRNSATFAGLLIENSSPFRDTESSQAESLAAATTKLHIVHLAHLQDTTYPIAGVRTETNAVKAAGFPLTLIERPGTHSDANTDADLVAYLLPHIDDGWLAPAP